MELCKKAMKYTNLKMEEKVETCQTLRSHQRWSPPSQQWVVLSSWVPWNLSPFQRQKAQPSETLEKIKFFFLGKQKGRSSSCSLLTITRTITRDRETKKKKVKGFNYIRKKEVQWGSVSHEFREILTVKSYVTRKEKTGHKRRLVYR